MNEKQFETTDDLLRMSENQFRCNHLQEMARLGKLRDLSIEKNNPTYSSKNRLEGNPYLPNEFVNLKILIPDSDWWWISSGSELYNNKGSTTGEGSFQFRFLLNNYFQFICSYDYYIGFTKIKIGFDDIDIEISDPNSVSISDMENLLNFNSEDIIKYILIKCKLDTVKKEKIEKLL